MVSKKNKPGNRIKNIKLSREEIRRQVIFWLCILVIFIAILSVFSTVLLPFVFGLVIAYFLNPIVNLLSHIGLSRIWASLLILLVFVALLGGALFFIAPAMFSQLGQFIAHIPSYVQNLQVNLTKSNTFTWLEVHTGLSQKIIYENVDNLLRQGSLFLSSILSSIWNSGKSLINLISIFIVAPVIAFYLMVDWERMLKAVDSWIPRDHLETVRGIFSEMDHAIAGFIRGQSILSLILGVYYILTLTAMGLNFAFLIGVFIGILSFIPYIGTLIGFILAVGTATMQFWPDQWMNIVIVVIIFLFGQFIEGYILQPKLVGSSVGLHPVWLLFSLLAFSFLFGFTGVLVAVPAAAAIGVLVRFALHVYLDSSMYKTRKDKV